MYALNFVYLNYIHDYTWYMITYIHEKWHKRLTELKKL